MDDKNTANKLFVQLHLLERQLASLEKDYAQTEAGRRSRLETWRAEPPPPYGQPKRNWAAERYEAPGTDHGSGQAGYTEEIRIEEMRVLLARIKEESTAILCETVVKEKKWAEMKQEVENAQNYITLLQNKLKEKEGAPPPDRSGPGAGPGGGARPDPGLTADSDGAHKLLEEERREFKEHYDTLEKDFETSEKKLIDEIRALKENDTKRALEHEKLSVELAIAEEKMQAAESKASSLSIEMMALNVYNKSAAAALREKDQEISDLKQSLEKNRTAPAGNGEKP